MAEPQLSREQLMARIMDLPPAQRDRAVALATRVYGRKPGSRKRTGPPRDAAQRRAFAGDPWKYFGDVLGWNLTDQQSRVLEVAEQYTRALFAAANNVGKTWLLGGYTVYLMDAFAAQPDAERELDEQGAMIMLPGPDHDTIFGTIYREALMHLRRARSRGFGMPGEWSEKSVLWRRRPDWYVEAFSPPEHVGQDVAHTVSGRHHRNLIAILEEGQGIREAVWRAVEGMCSGTGNKILSAFNPTEPVGPAYARSRTGTYHVMHLDAFGHPNVLQRRVVIPAAIAFQTIDDRVKTQCADRGAYPDVQPDPDRRDIVYALPPPNAEERGARTDGVPGHPDGTPRVYRPSGLFQAQVLGRWPDSSDTGLFDPAAWDAAVERWKRRPVPTAPPSRVGVDCAREGDDDSVIMPSWGEGGEALLRAWSELRTNAEGLEQLLTKRRIWVGEATVLTKGNGPHVAGQIAARYPRSPWNVDEGSVGTSVLDHAREVLGMQATGVSFGAAPPDPTPGEPWSENLRTAMYVRAALLVARGLVDVPDDPLLREEVLAHQTEARARVVDVHDGAGWHRERKPSVLLIEKKKVKQLLGRSPDRADAFVLTLLEPPATDAILPGVVSTTNPYGQF